MPSVSRRTGHRNSARQVLIRPVKNFIIVPIQCVTGTLMGRMGLELNLVRYSILQYKIDTQSEFRSVLCGQCR